MGQTLTDEEVMERQAEYEKSLSFFKTFAIFWRSTLWILYGQLVVFGYGIDGIIAGNLLAIPKFRYGLPVTTLVALELTIALF